MVLSAAPGMQHGVMNRDDASVRVGGGPLRRRVGDDVPFTWIEEGDDLIAGEEQPGDRWAGHRGLEV